MYYLVIVLFAVGWILFSIVWNYIGTKSPEMWSGKSLLSIWVLTLPNYGELLKLLIPSISRKTNCGWSNYSGKVISQEICENKMDNRVSKSIVRLIPAIVKEQRVDGNRYKKKKFDYI